MIAAIAVFITIILIIAWARSCKGSDAQKILSDFDDIERRLDKLERGGK